MPIELGEALGTAKEQLRLFRKRDKAEWVTVISSNVPFNIASSSYPSNRNVHSFLPSLSAFSLSTFLHRNLHSRAFPSLKSI